MSGRIRMAQLGFRFDEAGEPPFDEESEPDRSEKRRLQFIQDACQGGHWTLVKSLIKRGSIDYPQHVKNFSATHPGLEGAKLMTGAAKAWHAGEIYTDESEDSEEDVDDDSEDQPCGLKGFFAFLVEFREAHSEMDSKEAGKAAGGVWHSFTPAEKAQYGTPGA